MPNETFTHRTQIPASSSVVFDWHRRAGTLERLTPPWEPVELVGRTGGIEQSGSRVTLRVRMGPFRRLWISEHRDYQEGRQFRDVQVQGPFAAWEHTHLVEPVDEGSCFLEDRIEYRLPLGGLGRSIGSRLVKKKLNRLFQYRHDTAAQDIASHMRFAIPGKKMKILVSGSSGFVGSSLIPYLTTGGHEVIRLSRTRSSREDRGLWWDPDRREMDLSGLDGLDAVVHLAGENLGTGRWTGSKKNRILASRVEGTRFLCESLAKLPNPPGVLVSASAVGYYGSRGDEVLSEEAPPGSGFLAEVCRGWEEATEAARESGTRVVNLRIGVVMSPAGGALAQLLPAFRGGVGGPVGSGEQYMSWISMDDLAGVILFSLLEESLEGPVNAVAPHAVTNKELALTLGRILRRPARLALPAFAARLAFGEAADELLLASARVAPKKLLSTGYRFRHPRLETALRHLLGRVEET